MIKRKSRKAKPKAKKPRPDWEKLEMIIAGIQKELAPDAIVTHNDKIRGKMVEGKPGTLRKVDVSIKKKVGTTNILVAIDAKHHTRPVDRGLVAKFVEQVEDIGAIGIMISDSGFDGGARKVAYSKNILLQTIREAEVADWEKLIAGESWLSHTKCVLQNPKASVELDGFPEIMHLPFRTLLYKENGHNFEDNEPNGFNLSKLLWDTWDRLERPRQMGEFHLVVGGTIPPAFVQNNQGLFRVNKFIFEGNMIAKTYEMNLPMGEGIVLENDGSLDLKYVEVATQAFTPSQISIAQEGRVVSPEEWAKLEEEPVEEIEFDETAYHRFRLIYEPKQ